MSRELPIGVYELPSGRYRVKMWEQGTGKNINLGSYNTIEEAEEAREFSVRGYHWYGETPDPEGSYGFVYSGVNLSTEQVYYGRKAYQYYSKVTEERSILSDWEFYEGSSKTVDQCLLNGDKFKWTILANTKSNDESSLIEWSLIHAYLLRKLPSGNPMCLNRVLPKLFFDGLEEAKGATYFTIQEVLRRLP